MKRNHIIAFIIFAVVTGLPAYLIAQSFSVHEYSVGSAADLKLSSSCKGCHPEIHAEWSETIHSKSSYLDDPLHNAMKDMFQKAMTEAEKPAGYVCAHCHTPMITNMQGVITGQVALDDNDPRISEGIGCNFCHSIESLHDGQPAPYYMLKADGSVQGPGDSTKTTPVHEIHKNDIFKTADVCTGCHGYFMNELGVQICSLKEEEWNGEQTCQECHMVEAEGKPSILSDRTSHKSHKMSGGHDLDMLRSAVDLQLNITAGGGLLVTTALITNKSAHMLPSTMPMRMVVLKVTALDDQGNVVWENFKENAVAESPESVFVKMFKAGDRVGVPTWDAEEIAMDTRIPSGETITNIYQIPDQGVAKINATLIYFAVPPPAIEAFNLPKDGFIDVPHPIATVDVEI